MITIIFDSKPTSVLCHMGDFGCGDGGWTPVMKMDGKKVRSSLCQALSYWPLSMGLSNEIEREDRH